LVLMSALTIWRALTTRDDMRRSRGSGIPGAEADCTTRKR
jgi:hypothetical protein